MDRARCHLSVVRDEPPLRGIRLRDELRTVHRIQQFLIWGALVVGVLAFCGCSADATEPVPTYPAKCETIARNLQRCVDEIEGVACYGILRGGLLSEAVSLSCVRVEPMPLPSLGTDPRVRR